MLSRLRQSFRRKSSRHRHRKAGASEGIEDTEAYRDTASLRADRSVASSRTSLDSACTSIGSVSTRGRSRLKDSTTTLVNRPPPNPDTEWQKATPSVVECNRTMFNRQLQCDVTFVVGQREALVGAHRFVLVSRSDVFFRMFCGPMAETGPVVIPDVTEDVFRQFLEFLYVDEVSLTPDNVTPLHYLGRKYDVEPLVQKCLEFLHARLTCENACTILEQAHCFDEHELYKTSFEFVKENVRDCLSTVAVHDLCRGCLEKLFAVDTLEVSEYLLFKAALSWAEAALEKKHVTPDAENVRKELGHVLHLLRFPSMTFDTLNERVFPTGVLTLEETKGIGEYKDTGRTNSVPFICRGRQRILRRFQNVSRVRCTSTPETAKWTAAITFSCDRDFNLHGIHVFACTRDTTHHASLQFSILQGPDDIELFNRMKDYDHSYVYSGNNDGLKTLTINISPPRAMCANVNYTIVLQANMAACFVGTEGMASITCDDVTFRFRDAPVKLNSTTVSEGQIPCFVYSVR